VDITNLDNIHTDTPLTLPGGDTRFLKTPNSSGLRKQYTQLSKSSSSGIPIYQSKFNIVNPSIKKRVGLNSIRQLEFVNE
jgi:hypothetical protein